MRKLIQNKKGLSPIVASIILIVVTVAVSIAVGVWLFGATSSFLENPRKYEVEITETTFPLRNVVSLTINNTGSESVEICSIYINEEYQQVVFPRIPLDLKAGFQQELNITYVWTPKYNYQIKIIFAFLDSSQNYYKDLVAPAAE